VPGGSKGDEEPKSITKPVSFERLCQVTFVPLFMQNAVLALASATLAIEAADTTLRLASTLQGVDAAACFRARQLPASASVFRVLVQSVRNLIATVFCDSEGMSIER
jgi:hypothetical protein